MRSLFILADDLTGALDSAVQFAPRNIPVTVLPFFSDREDYDGVQAEVLVQNLDSRHLPAEEAAALVKAAVQKARAAGFRRFYKKTDSALRGNVGSELEALLNALQAEQLDFVPAYPEMGRTTRDGVQLMKGVPIHQTDFRLDPFEPVRESSVLRIIAAQSAVPCALGEWNPNQKGIRVHDCATDEEMLSIATRLFQQNDLYCCAGCAGFAKAIAEVLPLEVGAVSGEKPPEHLLVVCGSVNPASTAQLSYAEQKGFRRFTLDSSLWGEELPLGEQEIADLVKSSRQGHSLILDMKGDGEAKLLHPNLQAATCLAAAAFQLLKAGLNATVLATGGDTLSALLKYLNCERITVMGAVEEGIVLSGCETAWGHLSMISKAGSFGRFTLLEEIQNALQGERLL